MKANLIKYFGRALVENSKVDFVEITHYAMERGYLVHPDVCNKTVYEFLEKETINCNATFYKTWEDIISRDRFDMFIDQILHYISGGEYVPNEGADEIPYNTFKMITPITKEELFDECADVITSGIALKQDTMLDMVDYIVEYFKANPKDVYIDVDEIKNREAQTYLCDKLGLLPTDKFALLRYIIYRTTGSTMVIKNQNLVYRIKESSSPFDFSRLNQKQMNGLASIFLRYKPLFLAFKKVPYRLQGFGSGFVNGSNAKYINKLRKMAIKMHEPMPVNVLNNIYDPSNDLEEIEAQLPKLSLFKVIALMQGCNVRVQEFTKSEKDRLYIVRNQKSYIKHVDFSKIAADEFKRKSNYIFRLYNVLRNYVVGALKDKACVVKYPTNYTLVAPTSEKNFVGNYPFGTHFDMGNSDNFVGIYWKNAWGTHDFDLSYNNVNGARIGWNASWKNDEVLFSGDMVEADPEASEVLYFANGVKDGMIYVNRYNGMPSSKYKMYFGQEKVRNFKKGYMVDPNNIKVTVDMESKDNMEQSVGMVFDNQIYLMEITNANARVADSSTRMFECMKDKALSFIELRPLLEAAGFREPEMVENENGEMVEETPQLDLTNLDKGTLIKLFS